MEKVLQLGGKTYVLLKALGGGVLVVPPRSIGGIVLGEPPLLFRLNAVPIGKIHEAQRFPQSSCFIDC